MRVLVTQIMDAPRGDHWRGDSCYLYALYMVKAAVERGYFTYWVLPDIYEPPYMDQVKLIKFSMDESPKTNRHQHYKVMAVVEREFQGAVDEKFVDLVFCNDCYLALLLRDWFSAIRFWEYTPILHWNGFPSILEWSETNWVVNEDGFPLHARALGLASTDWISCCPYCTGRHTELVRGYCGSEMVKRFLETKSEVMMGPDCTELDAIDVQKNKRFSLYWGGRFTTTKGGEKSVKQYLQLMMGGREVDIYVTAVGGAARLDDVLKRYGARESVNVFRDLPYLEAMKVMKGCHTAIFYQLNPGASAPYEWMYGGVIVLFKKYHFPEEELMYPPGYPFMFDTDVECGSMLRWIYENYEEAKAQFDGCGTREWVREKMDKLQSAHRMWEIGEGKVVKAPEVEKGYKWAEETVDLVRNALEGIESPVPFSLLLDAMERVRGKKIIQRRWLGGIKGILPIRIYRNFIPEGWVDDCETEFPRYVKRSGE